MTSRIGARQALRLGDPMAPGAPVPRATGTGTTGPDERLLWRRATLVGARGRLRSELTSIVADLLGAATPDEPPVVCAEWIASTIEDVVSRASDAALGTLMQGLEGSLVRQPPEVARWLRRARDRQATGWF